MEYTHVAAPSSGFGTWAAARTANPFHIGGTDSDVVAAYEPLLRMARQTGQAVQIPAPGEPDGWSLEVARVTSGPEALVFRVTAPDGQTVLNAVVGSTMGCLIESLGPGLCNWPSAAVWLPDFSLCVARCWLDELGRRHATQGKCGPRREHDV